MGQDVPLDLTRRREREAVEQLDLLGELVGRDAVSEEVDDLLLPRFGRGASRSQRLFPNVQRHWLDWYSVQPPWKFRPRQAFDGTAIALERHGVLIVIDSVQIVEANAVVPEDFVLRLIGDRQSQELLRCVWIV